VIISTATGIHLTKYHDQVLEIKGNPVDGQINWEIYPAKDYKVPGWKLVLRDFLGLLSDPTASE
jgi:hypothetical protein